MLKLEDFKPSCAPSDLPTDDYDPQLYFTRLSSTDEYNCDARIYFRINAEINSFVKKRLGKYDK
jgi:hypothetical protein